MTMQVKNKYKQLWLLTHEVVVPGHLPRHHEEAQEAIGEQHLHSFVVRRQVAFGVVALVGVLPAPLVTTGRHLVGRQGARAWGEAEKWGKKNQHILKYP